MGSYRDRVIPAIVVTLFVVGIGFFLSQGMRNLGQQDDQPDTVAGDAGRAEDAVPQAADSGSVAGSDGTKLGAAPEPRAAVSVLVAELADGQFHLSGVVPDQATADRLVAAAFVAYGPAVTTDLRVAANVAPAPWLASADQGLTLLPMITEGSIRAEGERVEVTGLSPNQQYLTAFEQAVAATYGVAEVASAVEITNLTAPRFNARRQHGTLVLAGELPNDQLRQYIAGGAAAVYGVEAVDDQTTTGDGLYVSYWMYTMPGVFELLAAFPDYEINVENGITTGSLNDGANFATGSAELDQPTKAVLDVAVAILARDQSLGMLVEGHTDSVGSQAMNQRLSEARAASAVEYLVAAGVDAARLTSVGYGEDLPIATNDTAAGRASNRRVVFAFEQRSLFDG